MLAKNLFRSIRVSQFGPSSVLEVKELDVPEIKDNEILIKVKAVGINPVDTYIRSGNYARKPETPYTPGSDAAGVIEQIGSNIQSNWKVGDRVYLAGSQSGVYAEKAVVSSHHIHSLPDHVTFEQGASVYVPYATAYSALFFRANAKKGESVLIHGGSGGVGLAAIQFAKHSGLKIFATASSQEGLDAIASYGGKGFNHRKEGYQDEIIAANDNKGMDVIIEMLANVNLEADISKLLTRNGRVVVVGNRGTIEINPRALMMNNSSIIGMALANNTSEENTEAFKAIETGLNEKWLAPVVGKTFSLDDAPAAHDYVIERPSGAIGNVILLP